jgi:putative transposase
VFRKPVFVSLVLAEIATVAEAECLAVLAYCFMPDHVHLLVEGDAPSADVRRFVWRVKQRSGYAYQRLVAARLWQRSWWDRVLRSEQQTWEVVCYLLENPVRAGLVERPLDYPYSGSLVFTRGDLVDAFAHRHRPAG